MLGDIRRLLSQTAAVGGEPGGGPREAGVWNLRAPNVIASHIDAPHEVCMAPMSYAWKFFVEILRKLRRRSCRTRGLGGQATNASTAMWDKKRWRERTYRLGYCTAAEKQFADVVIVHIQLAVASNTMLFCQDFWTSFSNNLRCWPTDYVCYRRFLVLAGGTSCPVLSSGVDPLNRGNWAGTTDQVRWPDGYQFF